MKKKKKRFCEGGIISDWMRGMREKQRRESKMIISRLRTRETKKMVIIMRVKKLSF